MKFGLKETQVQMICDVFSRQSKVVEVILYGSRDKGNFKPYYDIDLTVKGDELSLSLLLKIENDLDDFIIRLIIRS